MKSVYSFISFEIYEDEPRRAVAKEQVSICFKVPEREVLTSTENDDVDSDDYV